MRGKQPPFAGLVPRLVESGTLRGRSRLSKIGPGRLRKALDFSAVAALRWNPTIRAGRLRLQAAGKPTLVIIGAAMRKLIHLAYGVLKAGKANESGGGETAPVSAGRSAGTWVVSNRRSQASPPFLRVSVSIRSLRNPR